MMNNQQHSAINSVAGSNQRAGLASSQAIYQLQTSTNMSQLSHIQQQQQQQHPQHQQQPHMMSGYSSQQSQKPSDLSSRQYSPSMSTLNGSAYQPMAGHSLHSGMGMDNNQMNMHQHAEANAAAGHQYNQQQQQQQHHQYPSSLHQQQQQQQQPHHQHHQQPQAYQQSAQPNQHQHHMQNQKQMPQHMMQQSQQHQQQQQQQQYNPMHHGNQAAQQQVHQHSHNIPAHHQQPQQQQQLHQQPTPTPPPPQQQQQRQPYVHIQQRNNNQQQQQRNSNQQQQQQHSQQAAHQSKYDRGVQQPRRILQNTNSLNHQHRPNHRPVAKEPFVSTDSAKPKEASGVATEKDKDKNAAVAAAGDSIVVSDDESKKENKGEEKKQEEIADNSDSKSENKELANTKEKTPMTLIQELARFNKVERKYTLLDEQGPAHKKTFFVKLTLGKEEYTSPGASIRKAQQAVAAIALKETKFKHPEKPAWRAKKDLTLTEDGKLTPTVELNGLAMKRGETATYKAIEPQQPPYYYPQGMDPRSMDPRAMYSPRYYHYMRASRDPRYARSYWPMRYHYPRMNRGFYISLRVGHREFIGDGPTRQAARHSAAVKALKVLRNLPEKEKVAEPEPVVEEETADESDELKSKITLVHELAFRRKLTVKFEVTRESGPPHMKTFITRCTVGDLVSDGEGNKKKMSKKIAAEQMYEKLKELGPLPANAVKAKPKTHVYKKQNHIKAEIQQQKADPNYGVGVNPISRLIQIMCAQKKKEPVYNLISERGVSCRKEFIMQIDVEDKTCTGSGPTKKLAKRSAAEAMLELLGYNKPSPQPAKSSLRQPSIEGNGDKKVTFNENSLRGANDTRSSGSGHQQKVPGLLHLPSKTVVSAPTTTSSASTTPNNSSASKEPLVNLSSILKPNWRPELQLRELCKALSYPLEINDFTKSQGSTTEYMSRIHITTGGDGNQQQQTFMGSSNSMESARDLACMEALKVLVSKFKDMHPAGDGSSSHMKKSVMSRRAASGGGMVQ